MRISRYLRVGFVGTVMLTPAMAEDAQEVHEKALKVLREQGPAVEMGTSAPAPATPAAPTATVPTTTVTIQNAPAAPASSADHEQALRILREQGPAVERAAARGNTNGLVDLGLKVRPSVEFSREREAEIRRLRTDREEVLKQQARDLEAARQERLAQSRKKWEVDIAERERLRQRQREYDEMVARGIKPTLASGIKSEAMRTEEAQAKALEILRNTSDSEALSASTQATQPEVKVDVTPVPPAVETPPATTAPAAAASATAQTTPGVDEAKAVEARAQQILNERRAAEAAAAAARAQSTAPTPAVPLEQDPSPTAKIETTGTAVKSSAKYISPEDEAAARELQARALEAARQGQSSPLATPTPTATPPRRSAPEQAHDRALEDARTQVRQEQPATQQSTAETERRRKEMEDRARAVLQQQQSELQRQQAEITRQQAVPAPAAPTPATTPGATASPEDSAYSKELEERARQLLRERAATPESAPSRPGQPPRPTIPTVRPEQPRPAPTVASPAAPAPAERPVYSGAPVDNRTREMLERQNREINQQLGTPATAPAALPSDAEAKARELLRQAAAQSEGTAVTPAPSVPAPTVDVQPIPSAPAPVATPPSVAVTPVPADDDAAAARALEERAREIMRERQAGTTAAPAVPTQPAPTPEQPAAPAADAAESAAVHAKALETIRTTTPDKIAPPTVPTTDPSGVKLSKRQRLQTLTELYKADRLTPTQYHEQRAKIVAEPE